MRPRRTTASAWRRSCGVTTRRLDALKALVDDGAIGELRLVRAAFSFNMTDADVNVRMRPDLEGGALDGSRVLLRVGVASALRRAPERDRATRPRSQWRGCACRGDALVRRRRPRPAALRVRSAGLQRARAVRLRGLDPGQRPVALPAPRPDGHARGRCRADRGGAGQLVPVGARDLGRAIRGNGTPLLGRADAVGQARTIQAIYEAAGLGR